MEHIFYRQIHIIISILIAISSVSGVAQHTILQDGNDQEIESFLSDQDLFSEELLIASNAKQIYTISTGDLDGDGDKDIVIGSFKTDKISWFRNNGYNNFGNKQVIGNADNIASVHVSDMDGDGDLDVLSASTNDNDILLFENDGTGSFSEEQLIGNIVKAWSVTSADLDGDGDEDIIAGGSYYNMSAWFENLGENNFGPIQVISSSDFINSALDFFEVHVEDIDSDEDMDVLICSYDEDKISWLENSGTGAFLEEHIISNTVNGPADISTADIDGDGDPDVLCAGRLDGGQVLLFENLGASGFGPETVLSTQNQSLRNIDVHDLDLDGDIDIVANSSSQSTLSWYENDGSGNFDQHLLFTTPRSYSIHCADLDGDGIQDLISGRQVGIQWHENLSPSLDCSSFENGPVDLSKSFPYVNGVQDRVRLKFYKESPEIKYSDTDAAACDIKAWELRNLDPETGLVIGNVIQDPDTILLVDKKKSNPSGSPRTIFKWPLKYSSEGANNESRILPNKRYQWQVRCACNHGLGPESPWSAIKFFDTPDFDTSSGTFTGNISNEAVDPKSPIGQGVYYDELMVWPNPSSAELFIRLPEIASRETEDGVSLNVELIDRLGRTIPNSILDLSSSKGNDYVTLDLDPLAPGVYLLRLISASKLYSKTIVKE